jgi:hypothetical protein
VWWWSGCVPPEVELDAPRPAGSYPVVTPTAWAPAADDPFEVLRPAEVECPEGSWGAEELSGEPAFSVDTADCNYLSVEQPSLVDLQADDRLALRLWHFELTGPDGAVANLGLAIDGDLVWREVLPIPRDAELLTPTVRLERSYPAGSTVVFHASNHGANSYSLIAVELLVSEP